MLDNSCIPSESQEKGNGLETAYRSIHRTVNDLDAALETLRSAMGDT
ncbi:hypothetical protein [Variovorax sp. HJSM1_2]